MRPNDQSEARKPGNHDRSQDEESSAREVDELLAALG